MQNEKNDENEDLSKYYQLKTEDEKESFKNKREEYFSGVSALVPRVVAAKSKLENIQESLKVKIKQLENQLRNKAKDDAEKARQKSSIALNVSEKSHSQQNGSEDDLLKQDLEFCKLGLVEGAQISAKMDNDKFTLESILATRVKKSYHVITDIALKPLPSDRAKDKDRNKDRDKEKAKGDEKENSQDNNKNRNNKISAADLKKLRNGQSLDSKEVSKSPEKSHAPMQNINMSMMLRQNGGSSLI